MCVLFACSHYAINIHWIEWIMFTFVLIGSCDSSHPSQFVFCAFLSMIHFCRLVGPDMRIICDLPLSLRWIIERIEILSICCTVAYSHLEAKSASLSSAAIFGYIALKNSDIYQIQQNWLKFIQIRRWR